MKKLIAAFVFAASCGASYTAVASSCEYRCNTAYRLCMKEATGNTEAEIACWDALEHCNATCN